MTTLTVLTIPARVSRGAQLLDARWPGWAWLIDLNRPQAHYPWELLRQLYGEHGRGTRLLLPDGHDPADYAFAVETDLDDEQFATAVGALTTAWRTAIRTRRTTPADRSGTSGPQD